MFILKEYMTSCSSVTNHWNNYQNQIQKYLSTVSNNPYYYELLNDFKTENINKIINNLSSDYKAWVLENIENGGLGEQWVDVINSNFIEKSYMELFCVFLEKNVKIGELEKLKLVINDIDEIKNKILEDVPREKFQPTPLKYVTTTGIAYLECSVDYKYLYQKFNPPTNVVKSVSNSDTIFSDDVINTVVGCKLGSYPIKGFFKSGSKKNFFNCATLIIVLTPTKSANVKIFGNGKLHLTGVPNLDLGRKAVEIIIELLKSIQDDKESNSRIVFDKKRLNLREYNTVMINTCYDLGISINRDIFYQIITNRYGLSASYESDGYPGVKVDYFYNRNDIDNNNEVAIENEGKCLCKPSCTGKSNDIDKCKKLAINIFQSGSVIIAGGCSDIKPIHSGYKLINKIIGELVDEIRKIDSSKKKKLRKKNKVYYLQRQSISDNNNIDYNKLLNMKL